MTTINQESRYWAYRDVTERLKEPDFVLSKCDVIRGVTPTTKLAQSMSHEKAQPFIYGFFDPERKITGRIFPCDEILVLDIPIDVVVQNLRYPINRARFNIDVNPYHDFEKGETFGVRISEMSRRGEDPCFKLYSGITGFVNENLRGYKIKIGTKLLVRVKELRKLGKREFVLVEPVESLDDLEE